PFRRAHHLAVDRPDEAQLEAVQEPGSRKERGEEPREQEDRERHEADGECAQIGGSLEILDLRHDEEVDRERADRHQNRVPQTDRLRGRQPDIDALPAEELSMGFVGPSGERPRKRRDEPECDGDQSNGEEVRGRLPDAHATAAWVSQNWIPRTFVRFSIHALSVRMSPDARTVAELYGRTVAATGTIPTSRTSAYMAAR